MLRMAECGQTPLRDRNLHIALCQLAQYEAAAK